MTKFFGSLEFNVNLKARILGAQIRQPIGKIAFSFCSPIHAFWTNVRSRLTEHCRAIRSARCAVLQSRKKHASKILNIGYFGINFVCNKITNSMYVTKYKTVEKTAKLCQFFALAMKLKCQ